MLSHVTKSLDYLNQHMFRHVYSFVGRREERPQIVVMPECSDTLVLQIDARS